MTEKSVSSGNAGDNDAVENAGKSVNPFPLSASTTRAQAARWLGFEHAVGRMRGARIDVTEPEFWAYVEGYESARQQIGE
ncbi:hypothetical protein [Nocardia terpenica]|uniref:Uncharacterized protein n=1 Tax=Nocardia terpenica TaxID=455432 RepID=A0A6G9ZEY8_9NOCA|nr:hypothetical protein [Nocardia terpenica]QIS23666.1 hypothetical protein F6W96_40740 [Nocardia terpenica]